jgi:hypothetical protein
MIEMGTFVGLTSFISAFKFASSVSTPLLSTNIGGPSSSSIFDQSEIGLELEIELCKCCSLVVEGRTTTDVARDCLDFANLVCVNVLRTRVRVWELHVTVFFSTTKSRKLQ